jgi:hypothetical protein
MGLSELPNGCGFRDSSRHSLILRDVLKTLTRIAPKKSHHVYRANVLASVAEDLNLFINDLSEVEPNSLLRFALLVKFHGPAPDIGEGLWDAGIESTTPEGRQEVFDAGSPSHVSKTKGRQTVGRAGVPLQGRSQDRSMRDSMECAPY